MNSDQMQEQLRSRQAAHLRACFPNLPERDLMLLLYSSPQRAVHILQQSFGCELQDAKDAWNDYVLRYIDGAPQSFCELMKF